MKNHYIKNKEFHALIKEYAETQSRKIYNKLGENFLLIARNFMNKPSFINYTDDRKEEMISDAVYTMLKYMKNYNYIKYDNPLAYFTQFASNAFIQNIKKYTARGEMFVSLDLTENLDYTNTTSASGE